MLNVIRVMDVVVGGISLLLFLMDMYHFCGFKMNETLRGIISIIFIICVIYFEIDGFIIWFRSK